VTAGAGRTANVWDAAAGTVVATLSCHERSITSASFSADPSRIVTASRDGTARLWDARTGVLLATFNHPNEVWSAAFDPDGARVVTAGRDGKVRLWDARTAQLLVSLEGNRGARPPACFRSTPGSESEPVEGQFGGRAGHDKAATMLTQGAEAPMHARGL
jgi:WD40 repeat protein